MIVLSDYFSVIRVPKFSKYFASTSGRSQDHVWVLRRGGNGGNPSLVAFQRTEETKLFRHGVGNVLKLEAPELLVTCHVTLSATLRYDCTVLGYSRPAHRCGLQRRPPFLQVEFAQSDCPVQFYLILTSVSELGDASFKTNQFSGANTTFRGVWTTENLLVVCSVQLHVQVQHSNMIE